MEINPGINLNVQQLIATAKTPLLNLKLNQQFEAKLLGTDLVKNTLTLVVGENSIQIQANQALPPQMQLPVGTTLTLQVVRLIPQPEFKLLATLPNTPIPTSLSPSLSNIANSAANLPLSNATATSDTPLATNIATSANITPESKNNLLPQSFTPASATTSNPSGTVQPELHLKLLHVTAQPNAAPSKQVTTTPSNPGAQNPTLQETIAATKTRSNTTAHLDTTTQLTSDKTAQANSSTTTPPVNSKENTRFTPGQPMSAKVIAIDGKTVQLELTPTATSANKPSQLTLPAQGNPKISTPQTSPTIVVSLPLKDLKAALPTMHPEGNARLNIITPQAPASQPLKIGTSVQVSVMQNQGKVELTILPTTDTLVESQHINTALREQLPKQASPLHLLHQLMDQLPGLQQDRNVSETLKQLAQKILQILPDVKSLADPVVLKKTISDAGVFLEAKLAQSPADMEQNLSGDLKANLLKLHASIKESPRQVINIDDGIQAKAELLPELQQKTEQSLAKIVLDQLASLPKDDNPKQTWHLEIPYAHNDQLNKLDLTIERDTQGGSSNEQREENNWSVTLSITPPGLDTIHCKIIFAHNTINTYFRSENSLTCKRIKENADYLRAQFEANGLTPGHMDAHTGSFPQNMQEKLKQQSLFYGKA